MKRKYDYEYPKAALSSIMTVSFISCIIFNTCHIASPEINKSLLVCKLRMKMSLCPEILSRGYDDMRDVWNSDKKRNMLTSGQGKSLIFRVNKIVVFCHCFLASLVRIAALIDGIFFSCLMFYIERQIWASSFNSLIHHLGLLFCEIF